MFTFLFFPMKVPQVLPLVGLVVLCSCAHEEHHHHESAEYTATHPLRLDTSLHEDYVCQIHSIQHIELRSLEEGYVQNVYVDEGQSVRKGQLLFQIMPQVYRAEMHRAEAEVAFAEIEYRNTKSLADKNVVSANELALAEAELARCRAELELANVHLGFTEIHAPFDGIVGRFHDVRLGSLVEAGELLTTLSDNSAMWVYFNVPEAEYLDYATHPHPDKAKVNLQLANGRHYSEIGIVETIEADFNNETGNIAFRATFANPEGLLRNGETGAILMPVPLTDALLIPQKATYEVLDKKFVFTVDNGTVRAKEIQVGAEMPHLYVVTEGLSEQDVVLVEGLRKVKNGDAVATHLEDQRVIWAELNGLHAE